MNRVPFHRKALLVAAGIASLVVAFYIVDRLASRADRIEHMRRAADLVSVRDAILEHLHDTGRLPTSLGELAPHYLRVDQLNSGVALFRYDPHSRTIAMARPTPVQGILSRAIPPVSMDIPASQPVVRPRRREPPTAPSRAPSTPQGREPVRAPPAATPRKTGPVPPIGPALQPPPHGAHLFEAELYSDLNYGWEVHPDRTAGGGAYIHSKEGIANGLGQMGGCIADFYNIGEKPDYTYLKYHFHLPESGRYLIYGRFWTTGSHCSNCVVVGVDRNPLRSSRMGDGVGGYHGHSLQNWTPFRWVWTMLGGGYRYLEKGDHYLHLYLHEDGERLDQFALTKVPLRGDKPFKANLVPNAETAFRRKTRNQYRLTFDVKSVVMSKHLRPEASVAVRTVRPLKGRGRINVIMTDAGHDGEEIEFGAWDVDLAELPELSFLPIDFSRLDFDTLPRREYLMIARLSSRGDELASVHVPMMHPPHWEIAGPLPYCMNEAAGPLDVDAERPDIAWKPLLDTSFDAWGVIDFGVYAGKPSLHAPPRATAYARTRIHVPETDEYLLKIQSDDQMLLWIDGRLVLRHDNQAPVTRSVARPVVKLEEGDHTVRMRVNNREFTSYADGRWQASIRFRTTDDLLSGITGK